MHKRGKGKIKKSYTFKDIYKTYKKENPKGSPLYVTFKEFTLIMETTTSVIGDFMLLHARNIHLPYRLGDLRVVKIPEPKKRNINWERTKITGTLVYHLNEHTMGYKYVFQWRKRNLLNKNKDNFKFIATRGLKRRLAAILKNKEQDYFNIF